MDGLAGESRRWSDARILHDLRLVPLHVPGAQIVDQASGVPGPSEGRHVRGRRPAGIFFRSQPSMLFCQVRISFSTVQMYTI